MSGFMKGQKSSTNTCIESQSIVVEDSQTIIILSLLSLWRLILRVIQTHALYE